MRLPRLGIVGALVRRDYLVNRSYRLTLVLELFFGILSLLIYYFISRTFGDGTTQDLAGASSYFAFAAVGVALSMVIQAASARVAIRVREEQMTGTLEAIVAQPVTAAELAAGLAGFHFLFAMLRALVYILVAGLWLGVDLSEADWVGFAVVLVVSGVALTCIGVALAALVLVVKRAEVFVSAATLALTLLGGAYFPVSVLPGWVEPLARILPTRFAFDGVRAALFRGEDWAVPAVSLAAFSAAALPLGLLIFKRGLVFAKSRGSLASY